MTFNVSINRKIGSAPGYVERDLRKFLECGILAHCFARARCEQCGQDFLVAYSGKGRGGLCAQVQRVPLPILTVNSCSVTLLPCAATWQMECLQSEQR